MTELDADFLREQQLDRWERAASGWGRRAERLREYSMALSVWMIGQLALHPGHDVLELAAGPGDTGLLAAELVAPGGTLLCSDASEAMLDVARARAAELGIENVQFARLELEWIDLPTGSFDAALCRWGVMLCVDPEAALREIRRVLRPGGRVALAVWDEPSRNPWATIPTEAMIAHGHLEPPDRGAPGMFALSAPGALQELLEAAGFLEVVIDGVELARTYDSIGDFVGETLDLSMLFSDAFGGLGESQQAEVVGEIEALAAPLTAADGSVTFPGRALAAAASA